jgi:hypothetical protein
MPHKISTHYNKNFLIISNITWSTMRSKYVLTPWSRNLPEKPTLPQKFSVFYGTRMFIAALTTALCMSLS